MIAPSSSRYSSNDMVHNHYLEEAKKRTQEKDRNSDPSVMPFATSQSTTSKSRMCFSANHDACVTKFLNEVNTRAKVLSNQTTNINKPVEKISVAKKPERQILKGHRFSIKETTMVHEKTMSPRSCLRWKPTGRIFKTVGLRWVPTGKIFASSITKVDSEPTHGSNVDISYIHACKQTMDLSAGKSQSMVAEKADISETSATMVSQKMKLLSKENDSRPRTTTTRDAVENVTSGLVHQGQKASDYDNSSPVPPRQNVVPTTEK
ncbi:hypothetical protein Tco_0233491, partial [Tanacetum coccineum]